MITQLFETKDDHMKTSNICVRRDSGHRLWKKGGAMHYLFGRSPENIFTLRFGSSGKGKQWEGKREPRKQKHAIAKEQ